MKIDIDVERCNGHGQCEMFAPMIFELDDFGAVTQRRAVDDTDPVELDAVRTAAERCPEQVISLSAEQSPGMYRAHPSDGSPASQ